MFRTAVGVLMYLGYSIYVVSTLAFVAEGAREVAAPWWVLLPVWMASLAPGYFLWAKRGASIEI
jgi:hypothetical protein